MTDDGLRIVIGAPYEYAHGGRYVVVCIAEHWRGGGMLQEMVVYRLEAEPHGRHYLCSLAEFDLKFTPVPAAPPPGPVVVDYTSKGDPEY